MILQLLPDGVRPYKGVLSLLQLRSREAEGDRSWWVGLVYRQPQPPRPYAVPPPALGALYEDCGIDTGDLYDDSPRYSCWDFEYFFFPRLSISISVRWLRRRNRHPQAFTSNYKGGKP